MNFSELPQFTLFTLTDSYKKELVLYRKLGGKKPYFYNWHFGAKSMQTNINCVEEKTGKLVYLAVTKKVTPVDNLANKGLKDVQ